MLNLFHVKEDDPFATVILPIKKVYEYKRSRYCQFLIAENTELGKFLAIDGKIELTQNTYASYCDTMFEYIPASTNAGKALVLGSGIGLASAFLSSLGYEVDAVDVDGVMLKALDEHFRDWKHGINTPNRITTYIYDAFDYLEYLHGKEMNYNYDVIISDINDVSIASEECFNKEYIEKLKAILNPDGIFVYRGNDVIDDLMNDFQDVDIKLSESDKWTFNTIKFKEN